MKPFACACILGFCFFPLHAQESRPPFPEEWDPYPLRFPYALDESQFLAAPKEIKPVAPPKRPPARNFMLPGGARRPIRVLLRERVEALNINAPGGVRIRVRRPDGSAGDGPTLSGNLTVERRNGEFRVKAAHSFSAGPATGLRFIPVDSAVPLAIEGKPYRGNLEFYSEGAGLQCVNVLGLEEYLRGVVPLEMGRRDETGMEALKAQAVVARTFALKRMSPGRGGEFDLRSSVQDQVYGGAKGEFPLADQAIRETEGLVVTHADTLAQCYYHSTCGGMTASRHEVWGGAPIPYLVSLPDRDAQGRPWCKASDYMQWTRSWDASTLASILRANLAEAGVRDAPAFRSITALKVLGRFACGRIRALEVETNGGIFEMRGDKIRFGLKPGAGTGRILESARFNLEFAGTTITARGSGFGHGIGLCQMGALGRAQAGQEFREILAAYYPATTVARIR